LTQNKTTSRSSDETAQRIPMIPDAAAMLSESEDSACRVSKDRGVGHEEVVGVENLDQ
jgi:hypothetical protein